MSGPVRDKSAGTILHSFELGFGSSYGMSRDDPYMRVKDEEVGSQRLSDLMGWTIVPAGQVRTVLSGFNHVVGEVEIEDTGELVIEDGGELILV
jgi:hypothetical protein